MQLKTKIIDCDEEFPLARIIRLNVGSKEITAPKKVLSASRNKATNEIMLKNTAIRGIVEVYRHFDTDKIQNILTNNAEAARVSNEISASLKETENNEIIMGLIEYDSKGIIPSSEQTSMLLHIINNPYFDVATVPFLSKMPCEDYIKFLDTLAEHCKSFSFRLALVPFIPHYSISNLPALFKYYARKDVFMSNLICVDFNGSNPISQYMFVSAIVKEARKIEKETGQPVFLHAVNLKYGKATKKLDIVPAKDLMIFTMGFNSFASSHKKIAIAGGIGSFEPKTKLLNREDYGYYSPENANNIKDNKAYEVTVEDVLRNGKMAKVFNAERQSLEVCELAEKIKDHALKPYVMSKKQITKEPTILKKINKVQNTALQRTL